MCAVAGLQPGENVLGVGAHGLLAHLKLVGGMGGRPAVGQQLQDLALAPCQPAAAAALGYRWIGEALLLDRGADREPQLVGAGAAADVGACPGGESLRRQVPLGTVTVGDYAEGRL